MIRPLTKSEILSAVRNNLKMLERNINLIESNPRSFIDEDHIKRCFKTVRQRLQDEPFERMEFINSWLSALEREILK